MQVWKTLSKKIILPHSRFLAVEEHTVELPDGRIIDNWPWVITPDYVNVVTVTEDNLFLCFRQTKYALPGETLAVVGGYIEPGEDPLSAAQRELHEETGHEASDWVSLGSYVVDANRGAGTGYFFLARHARRVAAIHADDLEEQELLLLSRAEMETALTENRFKVMAWGAIVALALRRL